MSFGELDGRIPCEVQADQHEEQPETRARSGCQNQREHDTRRPDSFRALHHMASLFVEPACMLRGVGRALVVDAAVRASGQGAECLEVTAGPAQGFYERVGFYLVDAAQTRFGPAVRMRRNVRH